MLSLEDYARLLKIGKANFQNPKQRGGVGGKQQKRQKPAERRKDRNHYKKNKSQIKRDSKKYYHRVCKKNKKCMDKRKEYKKNPDRYKRRKAGDILLYEVENPANNEIKQPETGVNYKGVSPTHFVWEPEDKHPGAGMPDRHTDNVPPATSRVVPNGQYVKSARVSKSGTTIKEILRKTNPKVLNNALNVSVRKTGKETFTTGAYDIAIREEGSNVRVSCTCNFFRWQGPEHWAFNEGYLYGTPVGTASAPDKKDPQGHNKVCKHIVAAFALIED